METRLFKYAFLALIGALLFSGGYLLGQSSYAPFVIFGPSNSTPEEATTAFRPFWESWRLLHNEYYSQPLDDVQLVDGAIQGFIPLGDVVRIMRATGFVAG